MARSQITRNCLTRHFQSDIGTQTKLAWLSWAYVNWLGVDDVNYSTLIRRSIALLVEHVEHLVATANEGDDAHTRELLKVALANAGASTGVTPEQARTLPVLPFSVIRDAVKQRAKDTTDAARAQ